jgi:hypothetical protein
MKMLVGRNEKPKRNNVHLQALLTNLKTVLNEATPVPSLKQANLCKLLNHQVKPVKQVRPHPALKLQTDTRSMVLLIEIPSWPEPDRLGVPSHTDTSP